MIEETRQLLQDFIAPELRSIDARIAALEKRFDTQESKLDKQHGEVMDAIRRMEAYHLLSERLARLESKMQSAA